MIFLWYFVFFQEHINLIVGLVTQLGGDLKMGRYMLSSSRTFLRSFYSGSLDPGGGGYLTHVWV